MTLYPLFISKSGNAPQNLELCVVRKIDFSGDQAVRKTDEPPPSSAYTIILCESESGGQESSLIESKTSAIRAALRHSRYQRLSTLASDTQRAKWFIISFLTVPKSKHEELHGKFQKYVEQIYDNPKFDPVFSYLAPMDATSDVLLSVWAFKSSRDADVYMPSEEHVAFGNAVQTYFTAAEFFQAVVVPMDRSKL